MQFLQPLNTQQERELLVLSSDGEKDAQNKLVEHNMRLVAYLAKRYTLPNMDAEDVISIGTIGLIKAVKTFDITKGIKFVTYASRCITNEISMHLRKIKNKTKDKYLEDVVSMDNKGNSVTLLETLEGTKKEEVEERAELNEDIEMLYDVMKDLTQKEQLIIEYRFGIKRDMKKQEEIAEEFQISQSYVSRIEGKALRKLREKMEKHIS